MMEKKRISVINVPFSPGRRDVPAEQYADRTKISDVLHDGATPRQ